jgi:anti-sigma-K factor RskA
MKIQSPALIDHLASHYVLGHLSPRVCRRFEAYARQRGDLRAAIAQWENYVHSLAASVPAASPDPALWSRIEKKLFVSSPLKQPRWWTSLLGNGVTPLKLFASGAIGAALAFFATTLLTSRPNTDDVAALKRDALPQSYVGLLLDSKDNATLLASSLRHGKTLTVKLLKPLPELSGQQYRLWAMPIEGAPFAVGVVPVRGSATLPLADTSENLFAKVPRLVVVAEPTASTAQAPSGTPVLSGHCVKLW